MNKNRGFSKFNENLILLEANFWNFYHILTFPGVILGPTQNLGPIGLAVFDVHWIQTHEKDKQQSIYKEILEK